MNILGISAFYHDSAAALVQNGHICAAAQEERFSRKKHDASFPKAAIQFCLQQAKVHFDNIDYIVFYDKPLLKFERLFETYMAFAPRGFQSFLTAMPIWIKEKLFQKSLLIKELKTLGAKGDLEAKILFTEHHQSHAGSAYYPSPFDDAVVLTMDGVGEWATTSVAMGNKNKLTIAKEIHFPHSIGLLYSTFTYYTGFKVNSGEYKVMGLAPYGEPKFAPLILENLIDLKEDGSFRLNMNYFNYCTGLTMTNDNFAALFGGAPRKPTEPLTQRHMDLAASVQAVTEEIVLKMTRHLATETQLENLCLAGGVALNCVANGKILRDNRFKNIWIQPAAGDAGGALGSALCVYYDYLNNPKPASTQNDAMQGSYLGPAFSQEEIESRLTRIGAHFKTLDDSALFQTLAQSLQEGKAVGWFQGRMEFGPRALGARSIIADPRSRTMQKMLNLKVKYRESFRPFAPAVLAEKAKDWFGIDHSPYMLLVAEINEQHRLAMSHEEQKLFGIDKLNVARSKIPAITHVDYSARIQTVHRETNPKFHALLSAFDDLTGCPVLVNTSFNVRGEPIVCTPEDAFRCFMGTEIEILVVGYCVLYKENQNVSLKQDYKNAFELD